MSGKLALSAVAAGLVIGFNPLKHALNQYTHHPPSSGWVIVAALASVVLAVFSAQIQRSSAPLRAMALGADPLPDA